MRSKKVQVTENQLFISNKTYSVNLEAYLEGVSPNFF